MNSPDSHKSGAQRLEELLSVCKYSNLPQKIIEGLFDENYGEARRKYLGERTGMDWNTRIIVKEHIKNVFEKFEKVKDDTYLKGDRQQLENITSEITLLLIVSGISELITADDWSVNRKKLAEKSHGLQDDGFFKMQRVLANTYKLEYPIHLHKGPGNGILMYELTQKSLENPQDIPWQQIGVGDKLYFPIEPILEKYVKEELRDDPKIKQFIKILASILKIRLKNLWFNSNTATIVKWQKKGAFCDVNDILGELRNFVNAPNNEVEILIDPVDGKIRTSKYFEHDTIEDLDLDLQAIFMKILKYPDVTIKKFATISHRKRLQKSKNDLRKKKNGLQQIKNQISNKGINNRGESVLYREIYEMTDRNLRFSSEDTLETICNGLGEYIKELSNILEGVETEFEKTKSDGYSYDLSSVEQYFGGSLKFPKQTSETGKLFELIFEQDFCDGIKGHLGSGLIDLNKDAEMFFANFYQGYFTEIPELTDNKKVHLISATRSDSHENGEMFKQDIIQNLRQLAPGGVLTTDGIKESFSRIYRLEEILEALAEVGKEDFKAEVVVHKTTRKPLSIFIQRKHENGYLGIDEKNQFFDTDVDFETIEDVSSRPYIRIVNAVRKKLYEITRIGESDGSIDIFNKLQDKIRSATEEALINHIIKIDYTNPYTDSLAFAYREICNLQLIESDRSIEKLQELHKSGKISSDTGYMLNDVVLLECLKMNDWKWSEKIPLLIKATVAGYTSVNDFQKNIRQKIREQGDKIFKKEDIKSMIKEVETKVESVLHIYEGEVAARHGKLLRKLDPNSVHTFTRVTGDYDPAINNGYSFPFDQLPNNAELLGMQEVFSERMEECRNTINRFKKNIGVPKYKPICFISYQDCITNKFLTRQLQRIFGPEWVLDNVEILNMGFRPLDTVSEDVIRHFKHIQGKMESHYKFGGIIIGGGSWTDAYDQYGTAFKKFIGIPLYEAIKSKDSKLCQLAICASYQIMADIIGQVEYDGNIITEPGMSQFGATQIGIWKGRSSQRRHSIFQNFPDYFTTSMTHTGWVKDKRNKNQQNKHLHFISSHPSTGNPTAYSAAGGKIIGIQWHPEIRIKHPDDMQELNQEIREFRSFFQQNFGVGSGRIMNGFYGAQEHLKIDSGDYLMINMLYELSKKLK